MSDVIGAALIAGGVGVLSNIATYLGTRRQADVNITTVERQAEVELAKVQAENDRLREERREAERQNRRGAYQRLLAVLDRFDLYATGYPEATDETFNSALAEFNQLVGAVHLFGAEEVREALDPLTEAFEAIGMRMQQFTQVAYKSDRFNVADRERRNEVISATAALSDAMREDVTRGLLSP